MTDQTTPVPPTVSSVVKGEFIGPVQTTFSPQPVFQAAQTNWLAYDVPRMWDSVRGEASDVAWAQVRGWENLGQLLAAHHDSLARLREGLAAGWDPERSPAAKAFFRVVDDLIFSLREDAYAHSATARSLDGILSVLTTAKDKLGNMKSEWDGVTTDWLPEWWDGAAADLNTQARQVMIESEQAVKQYRTRLVIPAEYEVRDSVSTIVEPPPPPPPPPPAVKTIGKGKPGTVAVGGGPATPPPPVPGHDPVLPGGPILEGMPQPVPAVPGSPISVLPVPPGNAYAPTGGAYVLPGPGVGRGGWIAPMPVPASIANSAAAAHRGASAGSAAGVMPVTGMAVPPTAGPDRGSRGGRAGDVVWQIAQGVPPVIGDVPAPAPKQEQTPEIATVEKAFVDWFADVATPWTDDLSVTLPRRTDQPS